MTTGPGSDDDSAGRAEVVRAVAGRRRAAARRRPGERADRGDGRPSDCSRTAPTRCPPRRPFPGWRRFLDEYRSYMQIILLIAAVVSLAIGEWSTGAVLALLTVVNAMVGLRQAGKAESAMNALKSLTKRTARVRRDGVEASIPAEQVVVGDLVLLTAGDDVAADGRIIQASSLDIDESALTGESTPSSKETAALADTDLGPGDQVNMAFMNTPVTHGSGVMLVTAVGGDAQVGKIAGMLASTAKEQTPLTKQLNTLTLWIGAAALGTMIVMFALGLSRGQSADTLFITAIALAIAAIPTALPTVLQVILSAGAKELAGENAIVKELVSVETLGSTSAINSDKTGTLTMNQMTVVEVLDPVDRYTISGIGYGLEGKVHHAAGSSASIEGAILPYLDRQRRQAGGRQGRRRPDRGRAAGAGRQGRVGHRSDPGEVPATGDPAVRPHLQTDGDLQLGHRLVRPERGALLREGRRPRRDGPRGNRSRRRRQRAVGRRPEEAGGGCHAAHGERGPPGDGGGLPRPRPGRPSIRPATCSATSPTWN